MIRYVVASVAGGVLFGILDGLIHANPLAQRLYGAFRPIARQSVNALAGIAIDLVYGFVMSAVFLLLYRSLPGGTGLLKGLSFGLGVWFFRVVMSVMGQWMTLEVPPATLLYTLVTGLGEMLIIGAVLGIMLRPAAGGG
jgi:hypothetical protein